MEDLIELNMRMAQHEFGALDEKHKEYFSYAAGCLASMVSTAAELQDFLAKLPDSKRGHENAMSVVSLNREYLNIARLVAKDVAAGQTEKLVAMNINWDQSLVLAKLTNNEITKISIHWPGLIYRFSSSVVQQGVRLHAAAARHHATAVHSNSNLGR